MHVLKSVLNTDYTIVKEHWQQGKDFAWIDASLNIRKHKQLLELN